MLLPVKVDGFGGTVNQVVFHLDAEDVGVEGGFEGTVIQAVVHLEGR